jgi:hypothetical protein
MEAPPGGGFGNETFRFRVPDYYQESFTAMAENYAKFM